MAFSKSNIGKVGVYVKNPNETKLYATPGGSLVKTIPPMGVIGKSIGYNAAKTWVQIAHVEGLFTSDKKLWISLVQNPELMMGEPLTEAQEKEALLLGVGNAAAAAPGIPGVNKAVAETTVKVGQDITAFIGDFGKYFKWVLIIAICVVLVAVFIRISGK